VIPLERYPALYHDLMLTNRTIYQQCKLVHADLSEYNILFHDDSLWIIDVSQSVEHDHPSAFEFLRMDLRNVIAFFGGRGVRCLSLRRSFEFVTRESLEGESGDVLNQWIEEEETIGEQMEGEEEEGEERTRLEEEAAANKATEESVFLKSFIPRSLGEVLDPEKNLASGGAGTADKVVTKTKAVEEKEEVTSPSKSVRFTGVPRQADETEESEDEDEEEDEEGKDFVEKKPRGHRHEDKDAKKVRQIHIPYPN
jgi:RIO kinase 1